MIPFDVVIVGWIPVAVMIFALMPPARAIVMIYLIGWLLLPVGVLQKNTFLEIDKMVATNIALVVGALLCTPNLLRNFRLNIADVLLAVLCVSGFVASMTNELGAKDGLSQFIANFMLYGVPYLAGRLFFTTREALYSASQTIVRASALYALLAIWEWRMSPELHLWVYGTFQHSWNQHVRWGCWRPIVFFPHGLALGTFFAWTALLGLWMYRAGRLRPVFEGTAFPVIFALIGGVVVSMSFGPWGMFAVGVGLLAFWGRTANKWTLCVPILVAFTWMTIRYVPVSDGMWLVNWTNSASQERAESLEFRVRSENLLLDHAKERPFFGWGTWGRNRVRDEEGGDLATPDGLWVILVGTCGLVGLCSFYLWWCWPVFMSLARRNQTICGSAEKAILVAIGLQASNLVFNGFPDPLLTLLMGSLVTVFQTNSQPVPAQAVQQQWVSMPSPFIGQGGHSA